jgi:hypothetical protein
MVAANVVVTFATSCGGAVAGTSQGNTVKAIVGNVDRVNFNVPGGLPTGAYFISITDTLDGVGDFASDDCAVMDVTGSSAILNAFAPRNLLDDDGIAAAAIVYRVCNPGDMLRVTLVTRNAAAAVEARECS